MGGSIDGEYTVSQLAKVLNISRSSLLYYESVGLIAPERTQGGNYRVYSNKDVLNLMNALMLRNVGLSIDEIADRQNSCDSLDESSIDEYCDILSDRIAYLQAMKSALVDYRERRSCSDGPFAIRKVPRYLYALSNRGRGWSRFDRSPETDVLMDHAPLTGIGAVYNATLFDREPKVRWARFVTEENLRFLDVEAEHLLSIGGCRCLIVRRWSDSSLDNNFGPSERLAALDYLDERGFQAEGRAFVPLMFPREQFFFELCQPIVHVS